MFPGHRPASLVAAAPLTVIAPAGSNNTATVAFAVATTTGTAAAAQGVSAATLAATGDDTATPTPVPTAASDATLVAMAAPSETETVSRQYQLPPHQISVMDFPFPVSCINCNEKQLECKASSHSKGSCHHCLLTFKLHPTLNGNHPITMLTRYSFISYL